MYIDSVFYKVLRGDKLTEKQNKYMKKIRKRFSRIDIIVIKSSKTGSHLGNSKPCSVCSNMLKKVGIRNIYYSTSDGSIIMEKVINLKTDHLSQCSQLLI